VAWTIWHPNNGSDRFKREVMGALLILLLGKSSFRFLKRSRSPLLHQLDLVGREIIGYRERLLWNDEHKTWSMLEREGRLDFIMILL